MPPVSLLIKPASSLCNLRCKYCFYHSISDSRSVKSYGIMNDCIQEKLVKNALEYADQICTFAFQGGEPTLAGLSFYRLFVELVKKYNTKNVKVNYAIQTNGMVIDEEWARFLAENSFLVGISLDGYKDLHDASRTDVSEKGSFNRVLEAIRLFDKFHVEYNILCVVNAYTARHISKVYNFFRKNGFKYLQFIPCLDPLDEKPGGHDYSLTPERYTYFLKNLFDDWYKDLKSGNFISIRYFDNLVGMLMGYPPESCGMSGVCTAYFVVEADGGVYPCDFYVLDEWLLGNISETGLADMKNCRRAAEFVEISRHIDPKCRECRYFNLCRGGCRRNREPLVNDELALNYYCQAFRSFFEYAGSRLKELAVIFSHK